jgi:2,3-dihydroxyphenylpropionate 1,2-dioxygenase
MTILGGALLPHAPQFFTQPKTEDPETIRSVQQAGARIGERLRALQPDVWIIASNDHAQQFFHQCAPPFTLHVGGEARGEFAGRQFRYPVASEVAFELVRRLYRSGFDPAYTSTAEIDYAMGIPLTHVGVDGPLLPVYVNAYLPPQPSMERCHAFGQALARAVDALGLRAVVLASGGMSHFPGTDRYASPATEFDLAVLEKMKAGRLKHLIGLAEDELDDTGNIELRCWAVAAGALGDRKPDIVSWDPSWHHNYASLGFTEAAADAPFAPHYPNIRPELVRLTSALHTLSHDAAARTRYLADPAAFAASCDLPEGQRRALAALDREAIVGMGVHPLLHFLANMQIERLRAR